MSTVAATMFDNKNVCDTVKSQLRLIKKNKIDTEMVMSELRVLLKDKYPSVRTSLSELNIRVDRKRNANNILNEVRGHLVDLVRNSTIDIDYLFKVFIVNNEVVVRIKRSNS